MTRRNVLSAVLALIVVTLAGCGGAESPAGASPSASTRSPTPSASAGMTAEEFVAWAERTSLTSAVLRSMSRVQQVRAILRCADLGGVYYCLGHGFGEAPITDAMVREIAAETPPPTSEPGDMPLSALVDQRLALTDAARRAAEKSEVADAAAGIDKARQIAR